MALLDGKVAVITGAGRGLGRSHASTLAREGARVVVNDVGGTREGAGADSSPADEVVEQIRSAGGEAVANYDDVSHPEGAAAIVRQAVDAFGGVDVLVNNAGILRDKTLLKMDEAMWDAVLAVHLKGTFLCAQAAARQMAEQGRGGAIVNTTSVAGLKGNFGQSNYSAAKAGIYGLTLTHAIELAKHSIRVNAVAPVAKTRMTEDIAAVPEDMRPEHVSALVLFLASELASAVNGTVIGVHGSHLFGYRMSTSEGVTKPGGEVWTAQEIADQLERILGPAPAAAAPPAIEQGAAPPARAEAAAAAATPAPPAGAQGGAAGKVSRLLAMLPEFFRPDKAAGWNARMLFDVEGTGEHTLVVADGTAKVQPGLVGDPTCTVRLAADTLLDMAAGKLAGPSAYMQGKIKADNLGDLMKFGSAFKFDPERVRAALAGEAPAAPAAESVSAAAGTAAAPAAAPAAESGPSGKVSRLLAVLPEFFQPDQAAGWNARMLFDVEDAGEHTLVVADGAAKVQPGPVGDPTCTVRLAADTLLDMAAGKLAGPSAYMQGKIKADNLGDLMKFGSAFKFDPERVRAALAGEAPAAPAATAAAATPAPAPAAESGPAGKVSRLLAMLPEFFQPDKAAGWNARMLFDVEDAGEHTLVVADGAAKVQPGPVDDPTCTVRLAADTLLDMAAGKLAGPSAYMQGKIKADNLGDLMKFGSAFKFDPERVRAALAGEAPAAVAPAPATPAAATAEPEVAQEELVARLFAALPRFFRPERAPDWRARIQFEIDGADAHVLHVEQGRCRTEKGRTDAPTATVKIGADTLLDMARGKTSGQSAFMQGKIQADRLGDLMKFGQAFRFDSDSVQQALAQPASPTDTAPAATAATKNSEDLVGRRYPGEETTVEAEHTRAYARATNDLNPRYVDEAHPDALVAPPLFPVRLAHGLLMEAVADPALGIDMLRMVHGEQDMRWFATIRPGDRLAVDAEIADVRDVSTGQTVTLRQHVRRGEEEVAQMDTRLFVRAQRAADAPARPATGAAGPDRKREREREIALTDTVEVARDQAQRYADASLDRNPIHLDPAAAKAAGLPDVILHGLCTMAFASRAIVQEYLDGDPARLKRLRVRFTHPVLLGDRLTTRAWKSREDDTTTRLGFEVVNQDGVRVIGQGIAEVAR